MSIWELRQYIESRTPWWTIPAIILIAAMVYSWFDFISYRKKLK